MRAPRSATPEELAWLINRAGCWPVADMRGIVVPGIDGKPRAGVLLHSWTETAAQAHLVIESPIASRHLFEAAFRYVFLEAGRRVLTGLVRADNAKSLRLVKHLGFREAYRIPEGAAPRVDMVLIEMRRENCRWIRSERKAA